MASCRLVTLGRVETTTRLLATTDTPNLATLAKVYPLLDGCMTELLLVSTVLMLVGLLWWLVQGSDDDNGGGGLMQPVLVPIPVRRYGQGH